MSIFQGSSLLVSMMLACSTAVLAQTPQKTTATYDAWTVACETPSDSRQKVCELIQLQASEQNTPVSQITIRSTPGEKMLKLLIQFAPNLWLADGAKLTRGNDAGISVGFRWCLPVRCLADADITADGLKGFRDATTPAQLIFKDAQQRDVVIAVSLKGFAPALDTLLKH
jgi:invasion protein IalB